MWRAARISNPRQSRHRRNSQADRAENEIIFSRGPARTQCAILPALVQGALCSRDWSAMQFAGLPEFLDFSRTPAPSIGPDLFAVREYSPLEQRFKGPFEVGKKASRIPAQKLDRADAFERIPRRPEATRDECIVAADRTEQCV